MKKFYESPIAEVTVVETEDIIMTSLGEEEEKVETLSVLDLLTGKADLKWNF